MHLDYVKKVHYLEIKSSSDNTDEGKMHIKILIH